jgi:carboxyl-terminal processing protease
MASMKFVAKLRNGKSEFMDAWIIRNHNHPTGFVLRKVEGEWIVEHSQLREVKVGSIVTAFNGKSFDEFIDQKRELIPRSSDRNTVRELFKRAFLFPNTIDLKFKDGGTARIVRDKGDIRGQIFDTPISEGWLEDGIAYYPMRSFEDYEYELAARDFVIQHKDAKVLIFDVRNNVAGSTPHRLIESLIKAPYMPLLQKTWNYNSGAGAFASVMSAIDPSSQNEWSRGYLAGLSGSDRTIVSKPGMPRASGRTVFENKLIVLTNAWCNGVCEDFVNAMRTSGSATLVGRSTAGSGGQQYFHMFPIGIAFQIGAVRKYLPDGGEFEGVGIAPDVEVPMTIKSLQSPEDEILEKALEIAREAAGGAAAAQ